MKWSNSRPESAPFASPSPEFGTRCCTPYPAPIATALLPRGTTPADLRSSGRGWRDPFAIHVGIREVPQLQLAEFLRIGLRLLHWQIGILPHSYFSAMQ